MVHCRLNEIGLTFVSLSKAPPMTRLAACLLLAALITFAQGAARSHFETASIKPSGPDSRPGMSTTPGRLTFTKANLRRAIYIAYHLTPSEISGGPSWMDSFDFDITASLDPKDVIATASEQRQQILDALQVLLEDRFQLVLRRETKTQPIFLLTVAKTGFKLKDGSLLPEGTPGGYGNATTSRMVRKSVPISDLVYSLSGLLQRHIDDQTGLTGHYSFVLEWSKDSTDAANPSGIPAASLNDPSAAIARAMREQLGLDLHPGKGLVDSFVIERAEKPSAN